MKGIVLPACLAALCAGWPAIGSAHEGHEHEAAPPAAPGPALAPRFEAASDDFALLGVLEGERLVLYLDRYASNEPVAGAKIELESSAYRQAAAQAEQGTYSLAAGPLAQPGSHPLVIVVEAGGSADLLEGTLEVSRQANPDTAVRAASPAKPPLVAWVAGVAGLSLVGFGWVLWRRRARNSP